MFVIIAPLSGIFLVIVLVISLYMCLLCRKNKKINPKLETNSACESRLTESPSEPAVDLEVKSRASRVIRTDDSTIQKPDGIKENNTGLYLGLGTTKSTNGLERTDFLERDQAVHSCVLADIHCSNVSSKNVMIDTDNESTSSVENITYVSIDNYWASPEPICSSNSSRKNKILNLKLEETTRYCESAKSSATPAVVKSTVRLLSRASKVIYIDDIIIQKPDGMKENNTELYLGFGTTNFSNDLEPTTYLERDQAVQSCVVADIHCPTVPSKNVMIDTDNESTGSVKNSVYVSSCNYWAPLEPTRSSNYINARDQIKPHVNLKLSNSLPNLQTQYKKNVVYEDFNQ